MTNAGLKTGVLEAQQLVDACQSREGESIEPFLAKLATALGSADCDRVREFALVLSIETGLPSRKHIAAVNINAFYWAALKELNLVQTLVDPYYRRPGFPPLPGHEIRAKLIATSAERSAIRALTTGDASLIGRFATRTGEEWEHDMADAVDKLSEMLHEDRLEDYEGRVAVLPAGEPLAGSQSMATGPSELWTGSQMQRISASWALMVRIGMPSRIRTSA